jgi:hypothetical protein
MAMQGMYKGMQGAVSGRSDVKIVLRVPHASYGLDGQETDKEYT